MRTAGTALALLLALGAAGQAGETRAQRAWSWHPSLQVFGSIDEIGESAPDVVQRLADVSPALGVALANEVGWEGQRTRVEASAFGLLGSPFVEGRRTYFAAGRLHAVQSLGRGFRLSLDDSARWQRRDASAFTDFQRNEAILGIEWRRPRGVAIGLRLSDRRRSLPSVEELGFSRQGVSLATRLGLGARVSLETAVTWQHYSTLTATGGRYIVSAEVARFSARGVASMRGAVFGPRRTGPRYGRWPSGPMAPSPTLDPSEAGVGTRNNLVENLTLATVPTLETIDAAGMEIDLTSDPLLFDPLESDSDAWDFGRSKQVLVGLVSHRIGSAWFVSAVARVEHRHGPNLLISGGGTGLDFDDTQLALRASLRRRLGARLSLLVQGCHLKGWADREELRFARTLVAVGLQVRY